MEETQQSVKGKSKQEKKNYRWTNKKEKAAKTVSNAFNDTCIVENVVGRMKTTKAKYAMIKSLKERSDWAWDDELKMIKVGKEDAEDFIEENPYAKGLLNVSIEQYDELSLACGDDQATGSSGKAIADIQSETVDIEDVSETRGVPQKAKRSRQWEEAFSKLDGLSQQVSRLANAVSNVDQSFCDRVFYEVMNMEGFETLMLNSAFEYLTENPLAGKQFISKTHELRMNWLMSFAAKE
ncbi:hypothetical protein IFM89_028033 [Coptis chinensis]|uniref:Myb/SANT-like domain-containing protein n=1 Tax=Coptis chinensis TaxID=261450 RepID=A0A835HET8_9MAGN|nr:hypothetical protein IFM89_028033 [Coptis chinensis]